MADQTVKAALRFLVLTTLIVSLAFGQEAPRPAPSDGARRTTRPPMPPITRPVLFNTTDADRILEALQVYPPDNPWNVDISRWPVRSNSKRIIASIGANKRLRYNSDMSFVLVPPTQPRIPVKILDYADESDPGPFPVPDNLPIEGWPAAFRLSRSAAGPTLDDVQRDIRHEGGDRHAIVVDPVSRMAYEFYQARKTDSGWVAAQASVFDLKSNRLRPAGWTSADAAGLPIFPAVVRYDEVRRGQVDHAMRVTVRTTRRAYVAPATHFASRQENDNLPRMGERLRLRGNYDISGFSPAARAILTGLKKHGMFVADNGIEWAISVTPDERMPDLHDELRKVPGSAFEVVEDPRDQSAP
jgi:hypothetical protein